MTQTARIVAMEAKLDHAAEALAALEQALERYKGVVGELAELAEYMESGLWLQDYTDDAFGRIPKELKRGVLSQDALYDLLTDDCRLKQTMAELCKPKEP